jgi:hypothetical protein
MDTRVNKDPNMLVYLKRGFIFRYVCDYSVISLVSVKSQDIEVKLDDR